MITWKSRFLLSLIDHIDPAFTWSHHDSTHSPCPRRYILPSLDGTVTSSRPDPTVILSNKLSNSLCPAPSLCTIFRSITCEENTFTFSRFTSSLEVDFADVSVSVSRIEDLESRMLREERPNGSVMVREGVQALLSSEGPEFDGRVGGCRKNLQIQIVVSSTSIRIATQGFSLAHFPSSLIKTARMLSVCPPNLETCFRERGSQIRMIRSGVPAPISDPEGVVPREYMEAGGVGNSTVVCQKRGSELNLEWFTRSDVLNGLLRPSPISHSLIFRSNPPLATQ